MVSKFSSHADRVVEAVRAGSSVPEASRHCGVSVRTVERWLTQGRADADGPYGDFANLVDGIRRRQEVPSPERVATLGRDELEAVVSAAAQAGSVPAMRLLSELLAEESEPSEPDALDGIRARMYDRKATVAEAAQSE